MRALFSPSVASATRRLLRAVKRGDGAEARQAVAQQADANVRVPFQRTPADRVTRAPVLFWALQHQDTALIEALLEARASLDARAHGPDLALTSTDGFTALDVVQRQEDLLRLLRAGLLMNRPGGSIERDLVLHVAAAHGWTDAIKWVAARTASVDVRNARGQTPLHAAVRQAVPAPARPRQLGTIRVLCAAGASLLAKDAEGRSVMQLALLMCPEMLPVLVECGGSFDDLSEGQRQRLRTLPQDLHDRLDAAASCHRLRQVLLTPLAKATV